MTGKPGADKMPAGTTSGTPQVLLAHHLKQLKLPTLSHGSMTRSRVNAPATASIIPVICCAWSSLS